jgi:hypothetical protein
MRRDGVGSMKNWITPGWRRGAAATTLLIGAAGLAAVLTARDGRAQSGANPMSVPACQCAAATAVPALSTSVVHCLCGSMSCVLAQAGATAVPALQCVR